MWLIVLATFLWSLSGFFTQLPSLSQWPSEQRGICIGFWRAIFALVLLLPLVRRISWKIAMLPMVASFILMNLSFLVAMVVGSPANTIWLQYFAPVWVMIGAVVFFRDRPIWRDWWMLGCCTLGVLVILIMENHAEEANPNARWYAPWLAILSGVGYAGVILSMRCLPREDPAWLVSCNHLGTAIVVAPVLLLWGTSLPSGNLWWVLIGFGTIQMGLPYFLFAHGLRTTPSHLAAMITLLEPVILPIWVHLARLGDTTYVAPGWWTWVGGGCILFGLLSRYCLPTAARLNRPASLV